MSCKSTYKGVRYNSIAELKAANKFGIKSNLTSEQVIEESYTPNPFDIEEFEGIPVIFDDIMPVGARTNGTTIFLNRALLEQKFKDKSWTKGNLLNDGSKITPLPKDIFFDLEDFIDFVLNHEKAHTYLKKLPFESVGIYEDIINKEALSRMNKDIAFLEPEFQSAVQQDMLSEQDILVPNEDTEYLQEVADNLNSFEKGVFHPITTHNFA